MMDKHFLIHVEYRVHIKILKRIKEIIEKNIKDRLVLSKALVCCYFRKN